MRSKTWFSVAGDRACFHTIGKEPEKTVILAPNVQASLWKGKKEKWRNLYSKSSEAIHPQNKTVNVKSMHRRNYICSSCRKKKGPYFNETSILNEVCSSYFLMKGLIFSVKN